MQWSDFLENVFGVGLPAVCAVLGGILVWRTFQTDGQYGKEEKQWVQLRGHGRPCEADILGLARPPSRLTRRGPNAADMGAAELRLAWHDSAGMRQEAIVRTYIDVELIANFTPGHKVHVLCSDSTPPVVVIDRDRTQLEIPSSAMP